VLNIESEVKDFFENPSNFRDLLIPSIIFGVQHQMDTPEYEEFISSHFGDFIASDSIFEIPLQIVDPIFSRVSSNSATTIDQKIDFIIRSLKYCGRKASVLLRHMDARDIQIVDLWRLKEGEGSCIEIDWSFLCKFTSSIVCDFLSDCLKHESMLRHHDSLIESNRVVAAASQSLTAELGLRLSPFDSRLSDVESSLKSNSDHLDNVVKSLTHQIGALSERLRDIEGRIGMKLGIHEARLTEVENCKKEIEVGLHEFAAKTEGRLGGLETMTSELKRTLETFAASGFSGQSDRLKLMEAQIEEMEKLLELPRRKVIKYEPGRELKGSFHF
jgi:hypothetical protein